MKGWRANRYTMGAQPDAFYAGREHPARPVEWVAWDSNPDLTD